MLKLSNAKNPKIKVFNDILFIEIYIESKSHTFALFDSIAKICSGSLVDMLKKEFFFLIMEYSNSSCSKDWHLAPEFVMNCDSYSHNRDNSDTSTVVSVPESYDQRDFVLTSFTKEGSIINQAIIQACESSSIDLVLNQILPVVVPLTENIYGNFTVKTLVPFLSDKQRLELLKHMQGHILDLSFNKVSTFVLQKLASFCSSQEEETLYYREFKGRILESSKNKYASHVVRILYSNTTRKYLYVKELAGHFYELSTDKYGISVAKSLSHDPFVLREMLGSIRELMNDCYGNYAFQNLLHLWGDEINFEVISAIKHRVAELSTQKFASNAIERCLQIQEIRKAIIHEILQKQLVEKLVGNLYGSFVINTALNYAESNQQEQIRKLIPK